jgi:putative transposase
MRRSETARQKRLKGGACIDPDGFDAGKLIKGKKAYSCRHARSVAARDRSFRRRSDRDGGIWLLATLFGQIPFLAKLFADTAYAGSIFHTARAKVSPNFKTEIVKRFDRAKGFVPLPKRWIVERTIAWLHRCGRLAKDWENLNRNALAFLNSLPSVSCMAKKNHPAPVPSPRAQFLLCK